MKFPREQIEPEWIISVKYLKDLKSKIENQIPIKYISDLDLEDIEAVLLALEIADNPYGYDGKDDDDENDPLNPDFRKNGLWNDRPQDDDDSN